MKRLLMAWWREYFEERAQTAGKSSAKEEKTKMRQFVAIRNENLLRHYLEDGKIGRCTNTVSFWKNYSTSS